MPGPDKKIRYDIEVGADTKGSEKASKSFDEVEDAAKKAGKSVDELKDSASEKTSLNLDSAKATAEARGVHNAIQSANQAADDHASINIDGTKATSEANQTREAVEDAKKSAEKGTSKKSFFGRLKADMDELLERFPVLGKALSGIELAAKGPIGVVIGLVTALTLAFKGLVVGVRKYVSESRNIGKIDQALAQTGQLTKANRREVIALATEFENLTGVVRQDWVAVLTKLINFGSKKETLGIDAAAVENLAGLLGGRDGLSQAVDLYARALQGEFGSFQELGFQLDLTAGKHENLLKVQRLSARGAGQLRAEARSAGGEVDALGIAARRTAEGIGRLFANTGVLSGGISLLKNGLSAINELLPQTTKQLDGLQNKLPDLATAFEQTSASAAELVDKSLKRVGEEAEVADKKLRNLIARLREQEQAALAVTNAKAANELAQVDLDEADGKLTKGQANERRFQIREEASAEKVRIQIEANNKELERNSVAIEEAEQRSARALSEGENKAREIASEIDSRQELVDRRDSLKAEQKSIASERERLQAELAELEKIPAAALGAPWLAAGLREARIRRSGIRPQLEELDARDEVVNNEVSAIGPQADKAIVEIQELNSEMVALREAFVKTREDAEKLKEALEFKQESLERRNRTLGTVSGIEADTRETSREAERVRERREEEKREREERLNRESAELGSNIERFADRRLPQNEISDSIRERARSLNDGGDSREFADLEASLLEAFRAFENRDTRLARQIQQIGHRVRQIASQVENSR